MMKQTTMTAALLCTLGALCCTPGVSAADAPEVTVTIADGEGDLTLTQYALAVTDTDEDGALTINDALYLAHEAQYEGGAAAGYGSAQTDYGLSLTKLWGDEAGSAFGYYRNNSSAMSLADPIADGDSIYAFVYTDLTGFTDTYCYFDCSTRSGKQGETITLTLHAAAYDENWAPITVPVADAVITINGTETAYRTDDSGSVTLPLDTVGTFTISAVSDSMNLVPPCCLLSVEAAADTTAPVTTTTAAAPDTGDHAPVAALAGSGILLLTAICLRKKQHA